MTNNTQSSDLKTKETEKILLQGIYGNYEITASDEREVKLYRFSVLICSLSFFFGLNHWILWGPNHASIWLIPLTLSLGAALKWIHIYLSILHKLLQALWMLGLIGFSILLVQFGSNEILSNIASNKLLIFIIGPFFASLTGLGFKEFFCFRRPEAIGLTIILPIALIAHLLNLFDGIFVMALMNLASVLLLILAIRKFGSNVASDIGDKSVFEYLRKQNA